MLDAIVVGAGLAGLAAAWRLQQAGASVEVLEATDQVGGRAQTVTWQGFDLDPGTGYVAGASSLFMGLVEELGLRSDLRPYEQLLRQAALLEGDGLHSFQLALPGGLAWRQRAWSLRPALRRAGLCRPEALPGDHGLTAAEWLDPAGPARWALPLLSAEWGWQPDDLSAPVFLHLFSQLAKGRAWTFRGGIGHLARALGARLQVRAGARVTAVAATPDGACARIVGDGHGEMLEAAALVLAVPGTLVKGLLEGVPAGWTPLLDQVAYSAGLVVYLVLEVPVELELQPPCRLLAAGEEGALAGLAAVARSANRRRVLLRATLRRADELLLCPEDDIYALIQGEVLRLFPELVEGSILARRLFRWPAQAPCWRPAYLQALRGARPLLRRGPLFLAGDYLAGPGAGAALDDGWACGGDVLSYLGRRHGAPGR